MFVYEKIMKSVMGKPEMQEFMAEHPVHHAVVGAFYEFFKKGFTLNDLYPMIQFLGGPPPDPKVLAKRHDFLLEG